MGLLSIIRKIKRKEKEMRILMVYVSTTTQNIPNFRSSHGCFFFFWCKKVDLIDVVGVRAVALITQERLRLS